MARHRSTARKVASKVTKPSKEANAAPTDAGVKKEKKKRPASKHRLYDGGKTKKTKDEDEEIEGGTIAPADDDAKKASKKSTNAQRRNKIWWYQNSSLLPTSENTLKKELRQLFNIMKDEGMLQMDVELENPTKKVRVLTSNDKNGSGKGKKKNKREGSIVEKFSISKRALQNINDLHAYYVGDVLEIAQTMCNNFQKVTVKPSILDLAWWLTNKRMGPKWNMQLEPTVVVDV